MTVTATDRIEARVEATPDRPALRWDDGELTYRELWTEAAALGERLAACGLRPGDKVAVYSPNSHLAVVATLALLARGIVWLPVNSRDPAPVAGAALARFGCDAVLAHADLADEIPALREHVPSIRVALRLGDLAALGPQRPAAGPPDPQDVGLAAIFPTGGTTGVPKGVAFGHDRLGALFDAYARLQADPDEVYLAAAPLTHVGGRICLGVLASGGTTVILPGFDETAVFAAVERYRVTTFTVTPTMLYRLLDAPDRDRYDLSSLRRLVYGAAPTALSRVRQALDVFGPVLETGYGQTEAPMFVARLRPHEHVDPDGRPVPDARLGSVGRPTPVCEVRILGPDDAPARPGTPGRIAIRGDFTMTGYYRDRAATEAQTVDGFRLTGDLGLLDVDGYLHIVGRASEMIITGGFNVHPAEVENVLAGLPGVRECAVFGVPDERWGEAVIAAAVGDGLRPERLRELARPLLGGVKTPKRIEIIDELPRNANGKIIKRALAERFAPPGGTED